MYITTETQINIVVQIGSIVFSSVRTDSYKKFSLNLLSISIYFNLSYDKSQTLAQTINFILSKIYVDEGFLLSFQQKAFQVHSIFFRIGNSALKPGTYASFYMLKTNFTPC